MRCEDKRKILGRDNDYDSDSDSDSDSDNDNDNDNDNDFDSIFSPRSILSLFTCSRLFVHNSYSLLPPSLFPPLTSFPCSHLPTCAPPPFIRHCIYTPPALLFHFPLPAFIFGGDLSSFHGQTLCFPSTNTTSTSLLLSPPLPV